MKITQFKVNQLLAIFFILSLSTSLYARKPAVEDFVGVETEGYQKTPKGTEVLFNFENQLGSNKFKSNNTNTSGKTDIDAFNIDSFSTVMLFAFATLPFLMWFGINQSVKEQKTINSTQTPPKTQTTAKVESLDDYRKSKEDDEDKLAS